jgi:histidinol-phosphatase
VTIADRESEQLIRARLAKAFPSHSILGEEAGTTIGGDPDYKWIVDPIDGTKTFIAGVPFFGVMVALEIKGKANVGAVYFPAMDEMICAANGLGCWWNGRRAQVSKTANLKDALVLTSDMRMCNERGSGFTNLSRQTRLQRTWGDCYGYALVATGRADIMVDPKLSPWDCAALIPILEEAGGRFSSWANEVTHYTPDGVASNSILHEQTLAILNG